MFAKNNKSSNMHFQKLANLGKNLQLTIPILNITMLTSVPFLKVFWWQGWELRADLVGLQKPKSNRIKTIFYHLNLTSKYSDSFFNLPRPKNMIFRIIVHLPLFDAKAILFVLLSVRPPVCSSQLYEDDIHCAIDMALAHCHL